MTDKLRKEALKTIEALQDVNMAYRIGGRPKVKSLDWLWANKDRVIRELREGEGNG